MTKLLISTPDGHQEVYLLETEVVTIGRAEDNHLAWPGDSLISRYHASIARRHGDFWVHDYHSHNGTFVNQMKIEKKRLEEGDKITIGSYTLTFTKRTVEQPGAPVPTRVFKEDDPTRTRDHDLEVLRTVIEQLGRVVEREKLREAISDTFQVFYPQRAHLLLISPDQADLTPEASYGESIVHPVAAEVSFIRSAVDYVVEEKMAFLTHDVQDQGDSNLYSILCVPLLQSGQVIGVIYLDDSRRGRRFRKGDLELLSTIATQVSQAVERVRIHEKLEREMLLRSHLERFAAPSVVEEIIRQTHKKGELSTTAEEREVAILFSDIKNFTPMAARMKPTEIVRLLSRYLTEMTDVLFRFDGTLDKYIGDGIMAIFGAPIASSNHTEQAVLAALAMLERHSQLMAETPNEEQFAIRVGVNTGVAVVGFIGTPKRLEYTAVGNTVNIAARLESAANPNQVCIGDSSLQQLIMLQHVNPAKTWKIEEGLKMGQNTRVQIEFKGEQLIKNIKVEVYGLLTPDHQSGSSS